MGCDIHLYVEKYENGKWVHKNFNYGLRNYYLFSILADVRNGEGFAGSDTGDGFNYIDDHRFLPNNVSMHVLIDYLRWGTDAHSPSWFLVDELVKYDWEQTATIRGILSTEEYQEWKKSSDVFPKNYSSGVSGKYVVKIKESEINNKTDFTDNNLYIECEWNATYKECTAHFHKGFLPRLLKIGDPEDVRIVFWFDN